MNSSKEFLVKKKTKQELMEDLRRSPLISLKLRYFDRTEKSPKFLSKIPTTLKALTPIDPKKLNYSPLDPFLTFEKTSNCHTFSKLGRFEHNIFENFKSTSYSDRISKLTTLKPEEKETQALVLNKNKDMSGQSPKMKKLKISSLNQSYEIRRSLSKNRKHEILKQKSLKTKEKIELKFKKLEFRQHISVKPIQEYKSFLRY